MTDRRLTGWEGQLDCKRRSRDYTGELCVSLLVPAILLPRAGTSPRAVTAKNGIPGRPLITGESTSDMVSRISVLKSIDEISAEEWDACALGASAAAGSGENPTVTHVFLHCARGVSPG